MRKWILAVVTHSSRGRLGRGACALLALCLLCRFPAFADSEEGREEVSPLQWSIEALTICLDEREAWQDRLDALIDQPMRGTPSSEWHSFPAAERAARRAALDVRRITAIRRLDYILLGDHAAAFLDTPAERFRRSVRQVKPRRKDAFQRALRQVFADVTPCGLEALEATLFFTYFGIPFTPELLDRGLDPETLTGELEHHFHAHGEDHSPESAYLLMRPAKGHADFRYVDDLVWRLSGITSPAVARTRQRIDDRQEIITQEDLSDELKKVLQHPTRGFRTLEEPQGRPDLAPLLDGLGRFFRLSAEPARIRHYLHARTEELEEGLGTNIPDAVAHRLSEAVEDALFPDEASMERLTETAPAEILADIDPILEEWFADEVLPAVRDRLWNDPFAAAHGFLRSGILARRDGRVFRGSEARVEDRFLTLEELEGLGIDESMALLRANRIPPSFSSAFAQLERSLAEVTVSPEEALRMIDSSTFSARDRARLRGFVAEAGEDETISTADAYAWILRDAHRIRGAVDWDLAGDVIALMHAFKRERLAEEIETRMTADGLGPDEGSRLEAYLRAAGDILLELERRQISEWRFQESTGGGVVGRFLHRFLIGGGVPVELWVPGGTTGEEFAGMIDEIAPKNDRSGNDYRARRANDVRLLLDGREYHDAVVGVIDEAQNFINISSFDWKTDDGGREIAYRLMAKKIGIDGPGWDRFQERFQYGLPLAEESGAPTALYDIPPGRIRNLLIYDFFARSDDSTIAATRRQIEAVMGDTLRCPSVALCGDLSPIHRIAGDRFDPDRLSEPGYADAWDAFRSLQTIFERDAPDRLEEVHPRNSLAEYVADGDRLRLFVGRYGARRRDDPQSPLPVNIIADGKQNLFNVRLEPSVQFPWFYTDPIKDIYFPLHDFDVHLLLWKGIAEFPWHVGPVPIPGRCLFRTVPMPFIPYPWLNHVPGFRWAGAGMSVFLQYLLSSDVRVWWAMAAHSKSVSNERTAIESGMGIGTKYFNPFPGFSTWHDTGVLVEGEIVGDVNDHFVEVFNEARINNAGIPAWRGVQVDRLDYAEYRSPEGEERPEISVPEAWPAAGEGSFAVAEEFGPAVPALPVPLDRTWVVTTHPERGDFNYRGAFMAALAAAQRNIYIENAFLSDPLVPRMLIRKALEFGSRVECDSIAAPDCAERKRDAVQIHLVIPAASDKPVIDAVGTADFHEMLHLGIKIYRWDPPGGWASSRMLHTKAWLVDYAEEGPALAYVGSANATQRSHLADNEVGILTTSPEFAREVYARLFAPDMTAGSLLENPENFHVVWESNPIVRGSRRLQRFLVSLFWFF